MTETAGRPVRPLRGSAALVVAVIGLVLSLISCAVVGVVLVTRGWDPLPVQSAPQVASAGQVEVVAHVTLPPGTVLLSAAYSSGLDTRLSARFRFSRSQLDGFLASAQFGAAPTPGLRAVRMADNVGGGNLWDPDAATTVSGIDEQQPAAGGTHRKLLLDLDVPDVVTVYLYADRG